MSARQAVTTPLEFLTACPEPGRLIPGRGRYDTSWSRAPYPPEFRLQLMELAEAGRRPEKLAEESAVVAQRLQDMV